VLFYTTTAITGGAGVFDHFACAMTLRAGLLHGEKALLHTHLTMPATSGTSDRARTLGVRQIHDRFSHSDMTGIRIVVPVPRAASSNEISMLQRKSVPAADWLSER